MPIIDITEIKNFYKAGMRLAGLDLGSKTIGLAVSDYGLSLANPRGVLKRSKFDKDAQALALFFAEEAVAVAAIGLPLNMNGTSGPRVQSTRAFVRNMQNYTSVPFFFWDERLSTVAAERNLITMNVSRKKRATRIDSDAASFILQGVLDSCRFRHLLGEKF